MGQSSTSTERPMVVQKSNWGSFDEGFHIEIKVCGKDVSMLVDTEASVTILNQNFFNSLNSSSRPYISHVKIKMVTANDELSPFVGQIDVHIS